MKQIFCLLLLFPDASAHAEESDYQKSLIAQFRFYNTSRTEHKF